MSRRAQGGAQHGHAGKWHRPALPVAHGAGQFEGLRNGPMRARAAKQEKDEEEQLLHADFSEK